MTIFDKKKQKLVYYSSSPNFNPTTIAELTNPDILKQLTFQPFSNKDYDRLSTTKSRG